MPDARKWRRILPFKKKNTMRPSRVVIRSRSVEFGVNGRMGAGFGSSPPYTAANSSSEKDAPRCGE